MWHLQPTTLTARLYPAGSSYEDKDQFSAVTTIDLSNPSEAYIYAMLARENNSLVKSDIRDLYEKLYKDYGVSTILAARNGELLKYVRDTKWTRIK